MPDSYNDDLTKEWPLIFDYHGNGGNGWQQYDNSQYYRFKAAQNYVVVYPQGVNDSWQSADYATPGVNDLQFTSDLLAHIKENYCVDTNHVYASGKSNGGGFVDFLACSDNGDDFAAFAMGQDYTIVWVANGAKPSEFPLSLQMQLSSFHAPFVRSGCVDLATLEPTPSVLLYTRVGLERLKVKPDDRGLPSAGFYLLAKGVPIGFHEGKVDPEQDGESLGPAVVLGLLVALVTNDGKKGLTTGEQVFGWKAGERIARHFSGLIKQHRADSQTRKGESTAEQQEEAMVRRRAYSVLGLPAEAHLDEVKKSYGSRAEKLRQNREGLSVQSLQHRAAELQLAYEFILNEHSRA